jgi:hypothetical protein
LVNDYDSALEPQLDWVYMPAGAPEEYGVNTSGPANGNPATKNYVVEKRRVWQRQEAFLEAYRKCGKIGKSAQAIGMTRWAVDYWLKKDIFGFKDRIDMAHQDYVESLEEDMDEVCADRKGNHDILRIFRLKAEHPKKYREETKVLNADAPFEMLDRLKELARKERERQAALEAPAVEAVYREVPPNQEPAAPSPEQPAPTPPPSPSAPMPRAMNRPPQRPPWDTDNGNPPGRVKRR